MTDPRVAAIEKRLSEATQGDWIMEPIRPGDKEIYINQPGDSWERLECTVSRDDCDTKMAWANAKLIANAPSDLRYLLDQLKAQESQLARIIANLGVSVDGLKDDIISFQLKAHTEAKETK